jgi:hypothetical protein
VLRGEVLAGDRGVLNKAVIARRGAGGGVASAGEEIDVPEAPFEEAMAMLAAGRIRDAETILLLQHAALHLMGPGPSSRGEEDP